MHPLSGLSAQPEPELREPDPPELAGVVCDGEPAA